MGHRVLDTHSHLQSFFSRAIFSNILHFSPVQEPLSKRQNTLLDLTAKNVISDIILNMVAALTSEMSHIYTAQRYKGSVNINVK
jgi:hypothetical protein